MVCGTRKVSADMKKAAKRNSGRASCALWPRRFATVVVLSLCALALPAQTNAAPQSAEGTSSADEIRQLRQLVQDLQSRVAQLEHERQGTQAVVSSPTPQSTPAASSESTGAAGSSLTLTTEDRGILDYLHGTTINVGVDGYYDYNFNNPVGRVNLLRAYDVLSNSFSLNQANLIVERAPDVAAGRRFGARVDLLFGQATEAQQGNPVNELRSQAYRNIYQAYGTYVAPLGSGLTVDFGKWASSLGTEGAYAKDDINYTRSYLYELLPFYHVGFRFAYNISPRVAVGYDLVNGLNQSEDFNGFKSQQAQLVLKPTKNLSWTLNYYTGQEQRTVTNFAYAPSPTSPTLFPPLPLPTQPGLPVANIFPKADGRTHILDTYATWNASSKLTLAGEVDYFLSRTFQQSLPAYVIGGAGYIRYQLTPKFAVAGRGEYVSDPDGFLSGVGQALKEVTGTAEYKFGDGFLARAEYRHDWSNQPFFLSSFPGVLEKQQTTATLGMMWWFGRKQGSW